MTGLNHSTNQYRFLGLKLNRHTLTAVWPLFREQQERDMAALQIFTEDEPLPPSRRLVVILPDAYFDIFVLTKRIWNLAVTDCRQVLLLSKPSLEENENRVRYNLTTLAALIREPRVVVKTQLVLGMPLEQAARQCSQPDDVIVCFEEQRVHGFLKQNHLAEVIARTTRLPVYMLKGSVSEMKDPIAARLIDILLVLFSLATLVGFFALEVWIDQNSTGAFRSVLQILAVIGEVWIIAACASGSFKI